MVPTAAQNLNELAAASRTVLFVLSVLAVLPLVRRMVPGNPMVFQVVQGGSGVAALVGVCSVLVVLHSTTRALRQLW